MNLKQPLPPQNHLAILEAFSLLYEDLDLQTIESKLIDFISTTFDFDRTAFFFVKHSKNMVQGKLGRGFENELIENMREQITPGLHLTDPLHNGKPLHVDQPCGEPWESHLNVRKYVLVPIVNRRHSSCWEKQECSKAGCPPFRNKWMHCWLMPDFDCCMRTESRESGLEIACDSCHVFTEKGLESMEGILLGDNSLSGRSLSREETVTLSIICDAVGRAISNSKLFRNAVRESVKDFLTGLYNRRYFDNRVAEELSRATRYDDPLCLVFADIDNFKRINDTHGHSCGDEALKWVAELLKQNLRKGDVASRYGGDEFAILLTGTNLKEAVSVAEKIRCSAENSVFGPKGERIGITLSFGIAGVREGSPTGESLFRNADLALYRAKAEGRNQISVATGPVESQDRCG